MKIAVTGHSTGIGEALATQYIKRGHEIVGLSKRDGNNIRNTIKIAALIEPCDVFVNNAQAGYAQVELLFEMAKRWEGTNKHIINISTQMVGDPLSKNGLDEYRIQKVALEAAVSQLRFKQMGVRFTVVRPGDVATPNNDKTCPPAADCNVWAEKLINIFELAEPELVIPDITLAVL